MNHQTTYMTDGAGLRNWVPWRKTGRSFATSQNCMWWKIKTYHDPYYVNTTINDMLLKFKIDVGPALSVISERCVQRNISQGKIIGNECAFTQLQQRADRGIIHSPCQHNAEKSLYALGLNCNWRICPSFLLLGKIWLYTLNILHYTPELKNWKKNTKLHLVHTRVL